MHCALMYVFVQVCAPALHLSTLVSMRDAHTMHVLLCLRVECAHFESDSHNALEMLNACLAPNHTLYVRLSKL